MASRWRCAGGGHRICSAVLDGIWQGSAGSTDDGGLTALDAVANAEKAVPSA